MKTYKTEQFALSAYLIAEGLKLVGHKRVEGLSTFIFEDTPQLEKLVDEYNSFEARINPVLLSNAYKNLKTVMYSQETR